MFGTKSQLQYADVVLVISCVAQYNCHEMGRHFEVAQKEADRRAGRDREEDSANERHWVSDGRDRSEWCHGRGRRLREHHIVLGV